MQDDRTIDMSGGGPPTWPQPDGAQGPDDDGVGRRIGPYLLKRRIGEGGMGLVYEAEQQEPIRRQVALKMVKRGMDTAEFVARFGSERQALALMSHPCIAQVFDAGATENGRPYFVMEYVEGVPINTFCDEHGLCLRERLELFIHVCEGVQHAHQKAIIHRDLKPSNVLVTEVEGQHLPKIIDFGVAKAMDHNLMDGTMTTSAGQLVGTPEYMSPEQADLRGADIDTRTDVYALGVLLYELLVGQLPFRTAEMKDKGFLEVLRVIREVEPAKPSNRLTSIVKADTESATGMARCRKCDPATLRRMLRGDLDWITMKTLEKDRDRRYDSAAALARDVRRFLRNEPVEAGPPTARYRMRKFVARHRGGVVAAAVALTAVLLGIAGATTGLIRAKQAERQARIEAETASQVSDFLVDLFEVSDPDKARGATITAREILDAGSERIGSELADQPQTQARLMNVMGNVYRNLGLYDDAAPKLESALHLQEAAVPADDRALAGNLSDLADLYIVQARYAEAEAMLQRALELGDRSDREGRVQLATSLHELGSVYRRQGRYDEAEPMYRRALDLRSAALGADAPEVAGSYNSMAILAWQRGRFDEAEALYKQALSIWEAAYGEDHSDVAKGLNNLALLYQHLDRFDDARPIYERAIRIYERILGPEHPRTANAVNNLALNHYEAGRLDEAEPLCRHALALREAALGPEHPEVARTLNNLANICRDLGRFDEAEPLYARALAIREASLGAEHEDVAWTLRDYGRLLQREGRADEAVAYYERAVEVFSRAKGAGHPDLEEILRDYAGALRALGRAAAADSLDRWAADAAGS